jgi:hypothetical protein
MTMTIQDVLDEIVNSPREVAHRRRLAAIRAALGHDHDDATGLQTLDDAIAALLTRHAAALEALATAETALMEPWARQSMSSVDAALTAIRKVTP